MEGLSEGSKKKKKKFFWGRGIDSGHVVIVKRNVAKADIDLPNAGFSRSLQAVLCSRFYACTCIIELDGRVFMMP